MYLLILHPLRVELCCKLHRMTGPSGRLFTYWTRWLSHWALIKTGRITQYILLCLDESNMADNECCFEGKNHAWILRVRDLTWNWWKARFCLQVFCFLSILDRICAVVCLWSEYCSKSRQTMVKRVFISVAELWIFAGGGGGLSFQSLLEFTGLSGIFVL